MISCPMKSKDGSCRTLTLLSRMEMTPTEQLCKKCSTTYPPKGPNPVTCRAAKEFLESKDMPLPEHLAKCLETEAQSGIGSELEKLIASLQTRFGKILSMPDDCGCGAMRVRLDKLSADEVLKDIKPLSKDLYLRYTEYHKQMKVFKPFLILIARLLINEAVRNSKLEYPNS